MTVNVMANAMDRYPYVGVRPYSAEEEGCFFGRAREAAELVDLWRAERLVVLHGGAGSGKTSLLHAGLPPWTGGGAVDVLPIGRFVNRSPLPVAALPEHNPYTLALLTLWSPGEPANRLAGLTVLEFLRRRPAPRDRFGHPLLTLAAIDQAEELYGGPPEHAGHREAFLAELAEALSELDHLHVLLAVRDEYLPELMSGQARPALPFPLGPLTRDGALEAVARPIEGTGRWFADRVAENIVDDLSAGTGFVEPTLLQVVCSRLWNALPDDVETITADDLARYASVDRSLAAFCGSAVAGAAEEHDVSALQLAAWLQRNLTGVRAGGAVSEGAAEAEGVPSRVLRDLEDRHLLTVEAGAYRLLAAPLARAFERIDGKDLDAWAVEPRDRLDAAGAALADGELALAERRLELALRVSDEWDLRFRAEAESLGGDIAFARNEPARAEQHYRAAASLYETLQNTRAVAVLLVAIGRSLVAQGRAAEAMDSVRAAADRLPGDTFVHTELAHVLWRLGQNRTSLTVLREVIATDVSGGDALRVRGELLAELGEAEPALRDLDRVRGHQSSRVRAARALALATLGRLPEARAEVGMALASVGSDGPALLWAARVKAMDGDPAAAMDLAERSLSAHTPLSASQRDMALRFSAVETGRDD
ncbi:hypothetical protein Misp01_53140 [Microtetraspora sp. NBRC 13810]|uniref:tetratricopeptide repeat protein n=1 Tax=Microtetraspora sp. NBRC 13810 TaxID=3030990 RepID=UPI00255378F5|nr:hypothetical protein [Microtetraspora sp. NBRC 13810]GLW10185.1 hypothetical protein Misp01_53140 [Microtetraspora sp. NBRC 13810]